MREIRCHKCNKYKPVSGMKYEKTGTYLVCSECRGEKKEKPRIKPLTGPFGQPKIITYQCLNCRYKFRRSATFKDLSCPSCGGTKLLKYEKISANDILRLADDDRI